MDALLVLLFASLPAAAGGACGTLDLLDTAMRRQKVYPVTILEIDGSSQFRRRTRYELAVGPHTIKLAEQIPNSELSYSVRANLDRHIRSRDLTIDVTADMLYVLGAKFIEKDRNDVKKYWAPIVLEDGGHPCKLD